MADNIAALLAGAAKVDYSPKFEDIPKQYWNRLEEAYKQRTRDVFQDPSLYNPDGSIDPQKALSASLKAGGLQGAESAARVGDIGVQQQYLRNAAKAYDERWGSNPPPDTQAQPQTPNLPPSPSRNTGRQAAPDLTATPRTGATAPAQTAGAPAAGPFAKFLEAQGVPPQEHAQASINLQKAIMAKTGSPFKPLDMNNPEVRPKVQQVLMEFALNRANQGLNPNAVRTASDQPAPQQPQPPQQVAQPMPLPPPPGGPGGAAAALPPQPPPQAPVPQITVRPPPQQQPAPIQRPPAAAPVAPIDPAVAAGIITPDELRRFGSAAGVKEFYQRNIDRGLPKDQHAAAQKRIDDITHAQQPTEIMKKAAAQGLSVAELEKQEEKRKSDATLTKDVDIPTLNTGKEKSEAASNEIKTYHEAKNVLNQPGGIIAGAGGDQLLAMAKIAGKYLGIPAAEQAANRTEAFRAIMSGGVLQTVKQLGAGSGITNADVKFASDMVGKNITLDENSIRRIIALSEKVARRKIADHNAMVDKVVAANPLLAERANVWRVDQAPLQIRVSKVPHVGDVRFGKEYIGGPIRDGGSWVDADGPDTLRTP